MTARATPRSGKVRRTLTLDAELVEALNAESTNLSATVNTLVREALERRRRHAALGELVAEMTSRWGEPDPADVERFAQHLR